MPLYTALASLVERAKDPACSPDPQLGEFIANHLPNDVGQWRTELDLARSSDSLLVFYVQYHHVDQGRAAGWTDHTVRAKASLGWGYRLTVGGSDRDGCRAVIARMFCTALNAEVDDHGNGGYLGLETQNG